MDPWHFTQQHNTTLVTPDHTNSFTLYPLLFLRSFSYYPFPLVHHKGPGWVSKCSLCSSVSQIRPMQPISSTLSSRQWVAQPPRNRRQTGRYILLLAFSEDEMGPSLQGLKPGMDMDQLGNNCPGGRPMTNPMHAYSKVKSAVFTGAHAQLCMTRIATLE